MLGRKHTRAAAPRKTLQWFLLSQTLILTTQTIIPMPPKPQPLSKRSATFKLLHRGKEFQSSLLSHVSVASKADCGARCGDCCAMFTFGPGGTPSSPSGGTCKLHYRVLRPSTRYLTAAGATSYALSKTALGTCNSGYSSWCEQCFTLLGRNMTFIQAKDSCELESQRQLAMTQNVKDIDIAIAFTELTDGTCKSLWMGISKVNNDFNWLDNSHLSRDSPLWLPNYPPHDSPGGSRENCVVLDMMAAGLKTVTCDSVSKDTCVLCQPGH